MTRKKLIIGALLIIIGLPVAVILTIVGSIYYLDRTNGSITTSGQQRTYLIHVPPLYNAAKPVPLVISMHGAAGWPAQQMNVSHWNQLADEYGFIVVYPSGSDLPKIWHVDLGDGRSSDVQFISQLIDTVKASYNIDAARIYANGLSNGGGMAFVLSCALSDRIAAVGMVAAAQTLPLDWCTDQRAVPMIAFHGTADRIAPYHGGKSTMSPLPFPDLPTWTANWARKNRCEAKPVETAVAADVTRLEYQHCGEGADVVLYTIQGGGHSWPGGKPMPEWMVGTTSNSIDATRQMWEFFRAHPLAKK